MSQNRLIAAEDENTKWGYIYDAGGNIFSKAEYAVSLDLNDEKAYTLLLSDIEGDQ